MKSTLRVPLRQEYLPVATGFITGAAKACGADTKMEYALVLAVEEIFMRICGSASSSDDLQMEIRDGGYCVEVRLLFPAGSLEFGAFNLTARPALEGESLDDLGLFLAARMVDALRLSFEGEHIIALTLIKERDYPEASGEVAAHPAPEAAFALVRPGPEEIKRFAEMAVSRFPAESLPDFVRRPGKAVDMMQAGVLSAVFAATPRGAIDGGVFWQPDGRNPVQMLGPYVLCEPQHQAVLDALVEECIRCTARTQAAGIFCRLTPEALSAKHFDVLGEVSSQVFYYRHLVDDQGGVIFCHPEVQAFLERECERLLLPREIRPVKDCGERIAECSLLACDFRSSMASVTMRALIAGRDAESNVAAHLARFELEHIRNVWFELDLGEAWQAPFAPALTAAGMAPAVLIPKAGTGDLLVFRKAAR